MCVCFSLSLSIPMNLKPLCSLTFSLCWSYENALLSAHGYLKWTHWKLKSLFNIVHEERKKKKHQSHNKWRKKSTKWCSRFGTTPTFTKLVTTIAQCVGQLHSPPSCTERLTYGNTSNKLWGSLFYTRACLEGTAFSLRCNLGLALSSHRKFLPYPSFLIPHFSPSCFHNPMGQCCC